MDDSQVATLCSQGSDSKAESAGVGAVTPAMLWQVDGDVWVADEQPCTEPSHTATGVHVYRDGRPGESTRHMHACIINDLHYACMTETATICSQDLRPGRYPGQPPLPCTMHPPPGCGHSPHKRLLREQQ